MTDNIKYFIKPFQADNYKSHLKTHASKWEEYNKCSKEEKKVFFNVSPEKYVNTLDAHYGTNRNENTFYFDSDIVKKLIADMFFYADDDEEFISKEKALPLRSLRL